MMNYGQEWHIKKNGLFACLYTFIVDRYLSRNTIYMTQASMVVYYKVKLGEPRSRETFDIFSLSFDTIWNWQKNT